MKLWLIISTSSSSIFSEGSGYPSPGQGKSTHARVSAVNRRKHLSGIDSTIVISSREQILRTLSSPVLVVRRADESAGDLEAVTNLMTEYLQWALTMMAKDNVVFPGSFDSNSVRKGLGAYRPPKGRLLIAERGKKAVGIVALRSLDTGIFEIKRMYVRPEARGQHVGSRILDCLIEEARTLRARLIRLDSAWFMTDAQKLYKSRGFFERTPYVGTEIPLELQKRWGFFEKSL